VTVEVHLANGLPSFTVVGLADTEVKEARDGDARCAAGSGLNFPHNSASRSSAQADLAK
jgi:magnesium chelatase family protein